MSKLSSILHTSFYFLASSRYPFGWGVSIFLAVPRIITGLLLSLSFGADKFGTPWSSGEGAELPLFHVAGWFPEDVASFGLPFRLAPAFFAWFGAFSEAIGGLFFALGLGTRLWAGLIAATMLVAIFFQKWPDAMEWGSAWPLLPAAGFLWVALYGLVLGPGKLSLDAALLRKGK